MTSNGHRVAGVLACVPVLAYAAHGSHLAAGAAACAGILFGARMPDWLEHPFTGPGHRWLAHRTVTHWWPVWIGLAAAARVWLAGLPAWFAYGIAGGCLLHILCDATTPMGVPLLWPRGHRFRLPAARSGVLHEVFSLGVLGALCAGGAWLALRGFPVPAFARG